MCLAKILWMAGPIGLRFNRLIRFGANGGYAVPEIRAAYVYQADNSRPAIAAGYAGTPDSAVMQCVALGHSHWRVGMGLSGRVNSRVYFRVNYNIDARPGFQGHNLLASVGISF